MKVSFSKVFVVFLVVNHKAALQIYVLSENKFITDKTASSSNQFRIIGRKTDSNEVSLNCMIKRSLIYNEATATFHQWRYDGNVYG